MEHYDKINRNTQPDLTPKTVQTKGIYLPDNRPTSILQKKEQGVTTNFNTAKPVQLFSADDIKFMYANKMGLRHHDSKADAINEKTRGTAGGDAVPLNPIGSAGPRLAYPLMGIGTISDEIIQQFIQNVDLFISKSLSRTVSIKLGETTPRQLITTAINKSTFLLVNGMKGTDLPKDVEKKDYAGLGKAGKQKINASQIVSLMALNDSGVDIEFMELAHGDSIDAPIETHEQGEEVFNNLVFIFSEKLKDAVFKLRTGNDRFLIED